MALAFCVAAGANVFVTSSDDNKIISAVRLGARGGVNYREEKWGANVQRVAGGVLFDVVVDGAGGEGFKTFTQLLRLGGIIVSYGMTVKPKVEYTMAAVLRNIELKGSTMGSRLEFKEMLAFVSRHKLRPVVSQVWQGLESTEKAFEVLKQGSQFGKLVVQLKSSAKL
jgi:NADPH:quinone reductase-like Zn-dependent oxidoreductase